MEHVRIVTTARREPAVEPGWRVEPAGRHPRTGRPLWICFDPSQIELIRWIGPPTACVAESLRRQGFRPLNLSRLVDLWGRPTSDVDSSSATAEESFVTAAR
jgi:hypothetical protein